MARTRARLPHPTVGGKRVGGKEVLLAAKAARTQVQRKRATRKAKVGMKALREIRRYQKTTDFLIPRRSFQRLVREIMLGIDKNLRIKAPALEALQEAAEAMLVTELTLSNREAIHAKRVTLQTKDMEMVQTIRKGLLGFGKPGEERQRP